MCIVIMIWGIILVSFTASASYLYRSLETGKVKATEKKFGAIMNALSLYAQRHNRLPCPASPDWTDPAAIGREKPGCLADALSGFLYGGAQGVIPWRDLGLPEKDVKDAWGRYITYRPDFYLTRDRKAAGAAPLVHAACRGGEWYNAEGEHASKSLALFCCGRGGRAAPAGGFASATAESLFQIAQDEKVILARAGADIAAIMENDRRKIPLAYSSGWAGEATGQPLNGSFELQQYGPMSASFPILRASGAGAILISHGKNGNFAFLKGKPKTERLGAVISEKGELLMREGHEYDAEEALNISGLIGGAVRHEKLGGSQMDDLTTMLRSDQIMSLAGRGHCRPPPSPPPALCRGY